MADRQLNALLKSKILVGIIIALMGVVGVLKLAQGFINTDYYRAQIIETIKARTGKDIQIRGKVTFTFLPTPTLYLPGVEMHETGSNKAGPALSIDVVYVRPTMGSLFGAPEIRGIELDHPVLQVTRGYDNKIHWGWLTTDLMHAMGGGDSISLKIRDGALIYRNERTDFLMAVQNIEANGTAGSELNLAGGMVVNSKVVQFEVSSQGSALGEAVPLNLTMMSGENNRFAIDGTITLAENTPQVEAKVDFAVENLLEWLGPKQIASQEALDVVTNESQVREKYETIMPAKFSGTWRQSGPTVQLDIAKFEGLNSEGAGVVEMGWVNNLPAIDIDFTFERLDQDNWNQLIAGLWGERPKSDVLPYQAARELQVNPIPADLSVVLNVKAKQILVDEQVWQDGRLLAKLENATITINQFDLRLPGDSFISIFGLISHTTTSGIRFEGSMETAGESLKDLLTIFDESASDLPEKEFSKFYIRSNLYFASEKIILSEADARISDLRLNGGLVIHNDAIPRLEADVGLSGIDFDYFRDTWRENHAQGAGENEFFLQYDRSQNFNWLRKLKANIDLKVVVNGFRFLERNGTSASFRLYATGGEFGIHNVTFYYPGDVLQGGFTLNVKGERPAFNVLLNVSELNVDYFKANPNEKPVRTYVPGEPYQWSEELIDMGWMEDFVGSFDISIGKLIYDDMEFTNFRLGTELKDNLMKISSLSFGYWGGRCSINGSVYGGKVPGLSIGFTLFNAELNDILSSTIGRENISGKVSISGTFATSGVNYLSWVSQATSEIVVTGRGVLVRDFNLQGVIDAVAVSRNSKDVLNNANFALVRGTSEMTVDGNLNVKNGVMRTPGVTLRSGSVIGNLSGEVRLVPWTMNLSTLYQFPAMASETVPTMTVQLLGSIGSPQMQVDTVSLEAYVAKRLVGSSMDR